MLRRVLGELEPGRDPASRDRGSGRCDRDRRDRGAGDETPEARRRLSLANPDAEFAQAIAEEEAGGKYALERRECEQRSARDGAPLPHQADRQDRCGQPGLAEQRVARPLVARVSRGAPRDRTRHTSLRIRTRRRSRRRAARATRGRCAPGTRGRRALAAPPKRAFARSASMRATGCSHGRATRDASPTSPSNARKLPRSLRNESQRAGVNASRHGSA